jgi:hypothetical protein
VSGTRSARPSGTDAAQSAPKRLHTLILAFKRSPEAPLLRADPPAMPRMQWQVFLAITFGYGFFDVCRLGLNVIKKPLVDAGLFDPAQLGMIGSALFFSHAIGRLVNGCWCITRTSGASWRAGCSLPRRSTCADGLADASTHAMTRVVSPDCHGR